MNISHPNHFSQISFSCEKQNKAQALHRGRKQTSPQEKGRQGRAVSKARNLLPPSNMTETVAENVTSCLGEELDFTSLCPTSNLHQYLRATKGKSEEECN